MNRDRILPLSVVAAVAAGVLVALSDGDLGPKTSAVRAIRRGESKLVEMPDGGKGYAVPVDLLDGGVEFVTETVAPCVRRPEGAPVESCMRREPDGGARDFGALNRFPADEAVGAGCEGVACSIVFGESSLESDDMKLARERQGRAK